MAGLLLAERVPENGNLLVVGAGGGLELKVFAEMQPGWRFCGVDPSAEMLELARRTTGPFASSIDFHHGYIDDAAGGPFDGATALLTLHFLPEDDRRRTITEVHRRLRPGAPFVVAHHSFPQEEPERTAWLNRFAAFAISSGITAANAKSAIAAIAEHLPLLSPEQDVSLMREAGFNNIGLFYAGFTFRGWVAYRC
jgi:tRNA (cmo5U34)-methyltransferase